MKKKQKIYYIIIIHHMKKRKKKVKKISNLLIKKCSFIFIYFKMFFSFCLKFKLSQIFVSFEFDG